MAKLIVELPAATHRELRDRASSEQRTIKSVVTDLVEGYLSRGREAPADRETGFCGRWEDERSAEEILAQVRTGRPWFRKRRVKLG